jgi:two-component system OmpR family sensor kinase
MDGFKVRLNDSIRLRLSFWLAVAILVVAFGAAVLSYLGALAEANALQDDTLRQVGALIAQRPGSMQALTTDAQGADPESRLVVQQLPGGEARAATLPLPADLADGLQSVQAQGKRYRVLVRALPGGSRIAIAQQAELRDEIARDSALRSLIPLFMLAPALLLIVGRLVRQMLAPVVGLSQEVDARSQHELHALSTEGVPAEVRPFISAVNRLLKRVAEAMESQRRFIADAAHELRSPMTALSLQAERLDAADMPNEARERLRTLRLGIERGRHLLDQLLGMARARGDPREPASPVAMDRVCRRVVEDLLPLAQAKGIDLGMVEGPRLDVRGHESDLVAIVRNLVDNAIRYTPAGGHVDLVIAREGERARLRVEDNGPGIPQHERARVSDPFYRIPGTGQIGSGLGLSIVKTIVDRLGGDLELGESRGSGQGLSVTVILPLWRHAG